MFDGTNGWAIASAEGVGDLAHRDELEAHSLFEVLERQIIPLFYDRAGARFPRGWITKMKASISSLGPKVMSSRMVRDYLEEMYEPAAAHHDALAANGHARARSLAAWKQRVGDAWPEVKVLSVESDLPSSPVDLGCESQVVVEVSLGSLGVEDVAVELLHGPVSAGDELSSVQVVRLELDPGSSGSRRDKAAAHRYRGSFRCEHAGRHGFALRVVPSHPDLAFPLEMGCVTWG